MRVKIKDIAYYLPEKVITNEDLVKDNPTWDVNIIEKRTGVLKRHIANENETALDLAFNACKKLFSIHKDAKNLIDGIIFCTQSEDYIMPPNSCILHKLLELPERVFSCDFNLACSGYIYGLALAQGLINAGTLKNILLINADTYSKYISKYDRSTRTLFGDGAAVTCITASDSEEGIVDLQCATSGNDYEKFIIKAGGCRMPKSAETSIRMKDQNGNIRTLENIQMDGLGILAFVNSKVPNQIKSVLEKNKFTLEDIDLFIFHQASKVVLDSLVNLLRIKPEKMFQNLSSVGNTVSASIPIALKDALECKKISKGNKILLCGFGVGLSWGTAIIAL